MRAFRDNWAFVLLLLIALLLVFLLIGLQSAILSNQQDTANDQNKGLLYVVRQQLALMIAPATDTPMPAIPTATVAPPTATTVPLPTATAALIPALPPTATLTQAVVIETLAVPTPLPLPTNTPVLLPTNTLVVLPTNTPQPVNTLILPTSTPVAPVAPPVNTAPLSTTQTLAPRADFRLGYLDRQDDCPLITEVIRLVLERNLSFKVETISYASIDELYLALAVTDEAQRLDLTVCYTDPDDRAYLQKHFGFVILVGSAYRQFDNKNFLILSNAAVKKIIQREQPCMYNFLTKLKIDDADLQNQDAAGWYETHSERIQSWTTCE